jgi:hypothetical protein
MRDTESKDHNRNLGFISKLPFAFHHKMGMDLCGTKYANRNWEHSQIVLGSQGCRSRKRNVEALYGTSLSSSEIDINLQCGTWVVGFTIRESTIENGISKTRTCNLERARWDL